MTMDEETPTAGRHKHTRTLSTSLTDFTMLEIEHPDGNQTMSTGGGGMGGGGVGGNLVVHAHQPSEDNAVVPKHTFVIMTETSNLTDKANESFPLLSSLADMGIEVQGQLRVREWKGDKFYSDYIYEGLHYKENELGADKTGSVVMVFESPSSSTSETTFHNKNAFRFHDWPPPASTKSKSVLGPCRYAAMNGTSYPVFLRDGHPPPGLLDHWIAAIPGFQEPRFVEKIQTDIDTVYAYLPVEQIPKHVNDPHKHYHLAGKDAIHLMTQKTTKLLPDTRTVRPCVVKTTHSMGSKGIFIIQTDADEAEFEKFLQDSGNPTFVVTDFVDIARNVACHFFMHPDGKNVTWFGSNENHREADGKFSLDSYLFMKDQSNLKKMQLPFVEEVVQYCHSLGFWGFCGIDVLFDSKGRGHLVDINPRVTGSCPALMTLRQLKDKYGFQVGLFRRSGNIAFPGTASQLLEQVNIYNTENEGTSRIVIHSMYEPEGKPYTSVNIGVYGNDMDVCKQVLNTYAHPKPLL